MLPQRRGLWLFGNLLLLLLALLVAFALGEAAVRALYKERIPLFPRYHTDVRYGPFTIRRVRPNAVFWHTSIDGAWKFTTNSQGFRNRVDFPYAKPSGTIRVLCLGDSHTQGFEARQDHTYAAVIERSLAKAGHRVEVINAGVSGFSTAEALIFLEHEGVKYQPDFVVLGFFANDFEDNLKAGLYKLENNQLRVAKHVHAPGVKIQNAIYRMPGVKWLSENSYFYSLLFNGVWNYFKAKLAQSATENGAEYAVATQSHASDYQIALAAALLERMHAVVKQDRGKLIVVDIPQPRDATGGFAPSIAGIFLARLQAASDEVLSSDEYLADYRGVTDIHVPHGHRHISEFTHTMIGAAVANRIIASLKRP